MLDTRQIFSRWIRWKWFIASLFLCIPFLQSCSSTAVQGTPVKAMVMARDPKVFGELPTQRKREVVAEMSRVSENKVFKEVSGVPEYRIGPLDVLTIDSRVGEKTTTTEVPVNSRGRISYSFLDDISVDDLTPSEVDALLTEKLSRYVRNPRIDVRVTKHQSKTALISGEFVSLRSRDIGQARSGRFYLNGKTTLMDLIAMAGGYTIDADIKRVRLIRQGRKFPINLYNIIERGDQSQNVIIDDGDIVDIPESPLGERVYVLGAVANQGVYQLRNARDLLTALSLAGNFTSEAKEEQTLIVRGYDAPGAKPLVMMADLDALLNKADVSQNIPLQDGDLVYVPRMLIGDINRWIENARPMLDLVRWPAETYTDYTGQRLIKNP